MPLRPIDLRTRSEWLFVLPRYIAQILSQSRRICRNGSSAASLQVVFNAKRSAAGITLPRAHGGVNRKSWRSGSAAASLDSKAAMLSAICLALSAMAALPARANKGHSGERIRTNVRWPGHFRAVIRWPSSSTIRSIISERFRGSNVMSEVVCGMRGGSEFIDIKWFDVGNMQDENAATTRCCLAKQ